LTVDAATEARLDAARLELVEAEDEWREVQLVLDAELERGALLDRRRDLREKASAMLGATRMRDVPGALRKLRVPAVPTPEAALRLRGALDAVGLPLAEEELSDEALAKLADAWLDEEERAVERREDVVGELDRLAAEREVVAQRAAEEAAVQAAPEAVDADDEQEERLQAARDALAEAEERLSRSESAEAAIAELEEQLAAAAVREREAVQAAEGADERVEAAVAAEERAVERLGELEGEVAAAAAAEEAAAAELRRLESGAVQVDDDLATDESARATALAEASARAEAAGGALVVAEAEREAMAAEVERLHREHAAATGDVVPSADEVEWYLLARLAAQRSVSYAGSMPLLLDDALAGLDDIEVTRLLERIERMAATVQLIVVSESPALGAWANAAGLERAAMVFPERAAVR
jgi:hypothetical protein